MKRKTLVQLIMAISLIALNTNYAKAQYEENWESLDKRIAPEWWGDAKFGIFIHWGLYSVPAYAPVNEVQGIYEKYAEHYESRLLTGNTLFTDFHKKYYGEDFTYEDFAPMFKAAHFNPDQWSELFKRAGAKYVVLTSKHHDGFCLWPSKFASRWNSVEAGPHVDIIDKLSASVRNSGLRFGLYYSLLEWTNPLYSKATIDRWTDEHMIPQMKELVNAYKPDVIFADGEWDYDSKTLKSEKFLAWLYNESPVKNTVIVNDRWGKETRSKHGDYYTTEYDLVHNQEGIGDQASHLWEESRGIGTSYGYNKFETPEHYLSSKDLIRTLIEKVSNGGNFLLNVGPDADGLIPPIMQQRLLDMGKWLDVNGEAIYGTKVWNDAQKNKQEHLYFTRKGDALYAIFTKWPEEPLVISGVNNSKQVELLGYKGKIDSSLKNGNLRIFVPKLTVENVPCEHAWVLKITGLKD